jgi:hypothetical protein
MSAGQRGEDIRSNLYFYFMAKRKKKKKTAEELGDENEFMKLKMMAEFGGNFVGSEDIPPDVENQFLKQIINFHKQHENSGLTTVYQYIGEPEYNHVNDLSDKEVKTELKRLMKLMVKNGVSLSVLAQTPDRDVYRFITEELFKHEIENVKLKGWVNQFIYEEFHPNADYDIKNTVAECLQSVFVKGSPFFEDRYSDDLKNSIGLSLDVEDLHSRIHEFWAGWNSVKLEDLNYTAIEIDDEKQSAHIVCDVEYKVQKEKGKRFKKENTVAEFNLKASNVVEGWWEIAQISCPVID